MPGCDSHASVAQCTEMKIDDAEACGEFKEVDERKKHRAVDGSWLCVQTFATEEHNAQQVDV